MSARFTAAAYAGRAEFVLDDGELDATVHVPCGRVVSGFKRTELAVTSALQAVTRNAPLNERLDNGSRTIAGQAKVRVVVSSLIGVSLDFHAPELRIPQECRRNRIDDEEAASLNDGTVCLKVDLLEDDQLVLFQHDQPTIRAAIGVFSAVVDFRLVRTTCW